MHSQLKKQMLVSDSRGFTVIELVVVIGLLMILAAISAPNISRMMAEADFRSDVRFLVGAIKSARMEAVKRNQLCSITFDTNAAGADIYTVYVDNDEDLSFTAGDVVLVNGTFRNAVINNNTLAANAAGDPANAFNGRGMPLNAAGGFGGGTIQMRGGVNAPTMARDIVMNTVGRLRLQ